jgi:hypothetical protein
MSSKKLVLKRCPGTKRTHMYKREPHEQIEKKQLTPLMLREKLELRIHLVGCTFCRLFQRQSLLINRLLRGLFHAASPASTKLDESFKNELQKRIDEELGK